MENLLWWTGPGGEFCPAIVSASAFHRLTWLRMSADKSPALLSTIAIEAILAAVAAPVTSLLLAFVSPVCPGQAADVEGDGAVPQEQRFIRGKHRTRLRCRLDAAEDVDLVSAFLAFLVPLSKWAVECSRYHNCYGKYNEYEYQQHQYECKYNIRNGKGNYNWNGNRRYCRLCC